MDAVRPDRTPVENLMVEQRALSNVGDPYHLGADNCEHDMTFAQTGVATSSTVNTVLGLAIPRSHASTQQASPRQSRKPGDVADNRPFIEFIRIRPHRKKTRTNDAAF